jgi:hypothetical protein
MSARASGRPRLDRELDGPPGSWQQRGSSLPPAPPRRKAVTASARIAP